MYGSDAIETITTIHLEDGDLLVLSGRQARRIGQQALAILRARGLDHCLVLTTDKRELEVQALDRDVMRAAGWVRVEEAAALGAAGAPVEELVDQFLIDEDKPASAFTTLRPGHGPHL